MYSLKVKWMLGWFSKRIHQMELHDWGQLSVPFRPIRRCQLQGPLARSCGRSQPDPHAAELPTRQEGPPWEGASVRHTAQCPPPPHPPTPRTQRSAPLPRPQVHRAATPPVHTAPQPRTVGAWGQVLRLVLVFPSRWPFQKLGLQEWKQVDKTASCDWKTQPSQATLSQALQNHRAGRSTLKRLGHFKHMFRGSLHILNCLSSRKSPKQWFSGYTAKNVSCIFNISWKFVLNTSNLGYVLWCHCYICPEGILICSLPSNFDKYDVPNGAANL